jgi:shikimate dehydrogenase
MHNAALKVIGLEEEYMYEKLEVAPEDISSFVQKLREGTYVGANVTIPHKVAIIEFLDELTKEAELIGAVNTVFKKEGKLIGHKTDGIGCLKSLEEENIDVKGKKILIIGAGGASRSICTVMALNNVEQLMIADIEEEKAQELAKHINDNTNCTATAGCDATLFVEPADIIINCTPLGMKGKFEDKSVLTAEQLSGEQVVMDIVYNPQKTKLLKEAEKTGCKIVQGIGMFVHQGAVGFEIWTGQKAPIEIMKNTVLNALNE